MFLLLFFLSFTSDVCHSQMAYRRMVPYDPRYVMHRPPVRRSPMDALERLRLPMARYFPEVDTQIASAPYQPPVAPLSSYQLSPEDIYALPPQWTEDFVPERVEEEADYGNYEYESPFNAPVYRPATYGDEIYAPEPIMESEPSDGNLYNDLMVNYLLNDNEPKEPMDQSEIYGMQRRSSLDSNNKEGVISLSNVLEANKNATSSASGNFTLVPAAPIPSQPTPQVQVTAVPSSAEKKEIKSLVIPVPTAGNPDETEDVWRVQGQKEEPLFRPLQNSQKTTWAAMTRAKNSQQKSPIPLLKQMIQSGQKKNSFDPLTEELNDLKNHLKI
ncbi:uncharacterized protein LOC129219728 [Uloborus diversus]|uniref:uncharacterized protein LOC129219728 n=1 Tax=Uloborus diversus TaxID=327109 RepID=UPI00240A2335|nr:uncharacterized protein LOC129219728 [Uloborus diversus]